MISQSRHAGPVYPLRPGWLVPMGLVCGCAGAGLMAGAILRRCGRRGLGMFVGTGSFIAGVAFMLFLAVWPVETHWAILTALAVNLLSGAGFWLATHGTFSRYAKLHPQPPQERGKTRQIFSGALAGVFISLILGTPLSLACLLGMDFLLSSILPVVSEHGELFGRLGMTVFLMTLSGALCGGVAGRFCPEKDVPTVGLYSLVFVWIFLSGHVALETVFGIPAYQSASITRSSGLGYLGGAWLTTLLIGSWWGIVLFLYTIGGHRLGRLWKRVLIVTFLNILAAVNISVASGQTAEMFLSLGKYYERHAQVPIALWCYEKGLRKKPDETVASYLQYRVALLNHKLGNRAAAIEGFSRVVSRYNGYQSLVEKSSKFLNNIESGAAGRRVVLPGVEMRTEHKGSYCVPNSLGLAMRFWGSKRGARDIGESITDLGSGTILVDQAWYAANAGYHHDFLPMARLQDIRDCIDAGFPVLVYVPAHVFVIFGYDETLGTFITYDVATNDVWVEYVQRDFIRSWKKQGATLVLVYPDEQQGNLPKGMLERINELSSRFIHYHLHSIDAPTGEVSIPHLLEAARPDGKFFLPLTALWSSFPHLRSQLKEEIDPEIPIEQIREFFGENFDESLHLWGQYHNDQWFYPDQALYHAVDYLTSLGKYDVIEDLLVRVDQMGQLSPGLIQWMAMIDLALGQTDRGLGRIGRTGSEGNLYAGLAYRKRGDTEGALKELTGFVRTRVADLMEEGAGEQTFDSYGYPALAVANNVLKRTGSCGETCEDLEKAWWEWSFIAPYDAIVASGLANLLNRKLEDTDKEGNTAIYRETLRRNKIVQVRADNYNLP